MDLRNNEKAEAGQKTRIPTSETSGLSVQETGFWAKVWDWPTRLFHWLLAGSVMVGWYLGEYRSFTTIDYHFYLGYFTAGLLLFRLIWGFFGPPPVRFRNFIPTGSALLAYARRVFTRTPSLVAGHNPLGGISVVAILVVLAFQVITGFYAEDDALFASGPLMETVSSRAVLMANNLHHNGARVILILFGIHIAAILFYALWKRENLVLPMITGRKKIRTKQ